MHMSEIHKQLKETLLLYRQLLKVQQHQEALQKRLKEEAKALTMLESALKREERNVEIIEKGSLRSFFHQIVGDREKQVERKRQDYLDIALKYNELGKSIDLIEFELDVLNKKLIEFDRIQQRYRDLIKLREKELMQSDPGVGRDLLLLHKRIDHGQVMLKDIAEAMRAGREAEKIMIAIEKELRAARNWGRYDTAGGRYASSHAKHSAVQRAKDLSYRARHALLLFRRELEDVYEDAAIRIEVHIEGFDRFTDIFFDNIISDWIIQQKINAALNDVAKVRRQVASSLIQLEKDRPEVEKELVECEEKRESMILQSES